MPISSLPDSTLRAITSTIALNDAVSVVKELVDNALDAKATTIAIEISANTLDVIQVKDNGTGIGVEDRQLICKRGCTSKITTIEDLERLGGTSLGFRGEALASVADLSHSVTLTTRVDGETAGSMLKYGPTGTLLSCSSASHPVGSTIRIIDFLKSIPVRKQTAVKNTSKTLSTIKKLLQSYAFARATVRFSLKILKGKNDKANWQYVPVDNAGNLRDAAAKIIGKDVTGRSELRLKTGSGSGGSDVSSDNYSMIALLTIVNEDAAKLNNTGNYVSIDGRPVSATRGTIKEVVKLYRHYVRNCAGSFKELPAAFDPLLVIHITCPRGSYDVNVEPAKDEVMFIDPEAVLALVESIFKDYYGEHSHSNTKADTSNKLSDVPRPISSFGLLLATKRPVQSIEPAEVLHDMSLTAASSSSSRDNINHSQDSKSPLLETPEHPKAPVLSGAECSEKSSEQDHEKGVRLNMYGIDEDEDEPPPSSPDSSAPANDLVEGRKDSTRNPWLLAKLNAPIRRPTNKCDDLGRPVGEQFNSLTATQHSNVTSQTTPQSGTHRQPLGLPGQLPSPVTSLHSPELFQNPGPPNRPWPSRQRREEISEPGSDQDTVSTMSSMQRREQVTRLLDGWAKPMGPRTEFPSFERVSDLYDKDGRIEQASGGDISGTPVTQRRPMLLQTPLSIGKQSQPQQTGPIGRPFRSTLLRSPSLTGSSNNSLCAGVPRAPSESQQPSFKSSQNQNPELDQIMEFEHSKKVANAQQRKAFKKPTGRGLNTAQLAQLQQSTMAESDEVALDDQASNVGPADSVAAFDSRFRVPDEHLQASQISNPHRNRYIAATKSLNRTETSQLDELIVADEPLSKIAKIVDDRGTTTKMADNDPRAYLMQQRGQIDSTSAGGWTKTGLKVRRTKTLRLPLEAVPAGMVVHDLAAAVDFNMRAYAEPGNGADEYSVTGRNEFIRWTSSMTNITAWQAELVSLVEKTYRGRVGNDLMSPNIELDLRRMIKTHCDNI